MASTRLKASPTVGSSRKSAASTAKRLPASANDNSREAIVRAICAEFDIEIIPANEAPKPGQTRAVATMCRILDKYGDGHFRLVMTTLAETKNNEGLITETSIWATSDLVRACSEWVERDPTSWLEAWDKIPMGFILWHCQELSGVIHQRYALAGAMYLMLVYFSNGKKADKDPGYGFIRRVQKAEGEMSIRERQKQEAIKAGRQLIEVKAALPRGEFMPWVRTQSGLSYDTALRYMRLASAAGPESAAECDEGESRPAEPDAAETRQLAYIG